VEGNVYRGFLLGADKKELEDLGNLGGQLTAGCAINDRRQIIGYSQDSYGNLTAFLYTENDGIRSLGTLGGTSEAFGLNSSGTAVGDCSTGNYQHVPTLFGNGNVQDLGLAGGTANDILQTGFAINDSNTVVGRRELRNGTTSGFLYSVKNNQVTDLGTLGGQNSEALAINKQGEIVGDSEAQDGITHAFFYSNQLQDLGFLPGYNQASYARAINDKSQIVGESDSSSAKHAFLFSQGQLYDLSSLAVNLSTAGFQSLDVAYGINNNGVIVGYGTSNDGRTIGFIAYPQEERKPLATNNPPAPSVSQNAPGDTYAVFYSRLHDDGDWVDAGNYGYCFHPHAARGNWRPYNDGHWVWTDQGWYWESNEDFGWACYHYGRWALIADVGWCWIPGHQWAPAWVSWRQSHEYCGWAPLPPDAGYDPQVRIAGWSDNYYGIGPQAYIFIPFSHWSERSYTRWAVPPEQNVTIVRQTTNITNIYTQNNVIVNNGPQVQYVSQQINRTIEPTKIVFNPQPQAQQFGSQLRGNQLQVVAPAQTLQPTSNVRPTVTQQIPNPVIQKGWQNVPHSQATQLRRTLAQQNPVPQNLPKPTPIPTPHFVSAAATPSPASKPGTTPGASPKTNVPPNLVSPTVKPGTTPGASPKTNVPPNLVSPTAKPGTTPGAPPKTNVPNLVSPAPGNKPVVTPTPKPTGTAHPNLPPNIATPTAKGTPEHPQVTTPKPTPQNTPPPVPTATPPKPVSSPTPHQAATPEPHKSAPAVEQKTEHTPAPTPHTPPPNTEGKPEHTPAPTHTPPPNQPPKVEEHKPANTPQPKKSATPAEKKETQAAPRKVEQHQVTAVHAVQTHTAHVEQPHVVQHAAAQRTVESKPPPQPHVQSKPQPPPQQHVQAQPKPPPAPHPQSKPAPQPHQENKGGGKPTPKK
ncbi:MAG: hypothetical protein JO308_04705, partial [Verrucomicrobia bacterium]|nr:hypothetical protein [Verrucomicrobiota bacterium]